MKKKLYSKKIAVVCLPILLILVIYLLRVWLFKLGNVLPACPIYKISGIYCPGCGNTRSIQHILTGDIIGSLEYNITPIFGVIFIFLAYIEFASHIFERRIKLIPRGKKFWIFIIAMFLLYYILRNLVRIF